jgi:FKBP-type peptidyl-prolyl cis-trans isomerase
VTLPERNDRRHRRRHRHRHGHRRRPVTATVTATATATLTGITRRAAVCSGGMRGLRLLVISLALVSCQKAADDKKSPTKAAPGAASQPGVAPADPHAQVKPGRPKIEQVKPPFDLKTPPADAVKTASGLIYKKLVTNEDGVAARRNDRVLINYTGWRQNSGETFYTNRARGQPMPLDLSNTAAGFTEAMQLVKKGEKAVLWVPPSIGYKGAPQGDAETLVYEVEVVEVVPAPEIPPDLAGPPAKAASTKSGVKYTVVKPGTGKDKVRAFDTVTFHYSAWDSEGRMFDSTEMRKRPASVAPFRQPAVMEEVLTQMTSGQRVRFWADASKMMQGERPLPGMPTGQLVYELEVESVEKGNPPPPVPADVAQPPAGAQKTAKGVFYKVLRAGKGGPKPTAIDAVKVHYTGWTTDGRMFDSSTVKNEPAEFRLDGVIAGWTDGIPVMSVGDRVRFWIPEELAYKGSPGRPQGMLVFDVELLEIKPQKAPDAPPPATGGDIPPAPPDVAAPPADAKKTAGGVFYKVLQQGGGGPKPTPQDRVKVHYTGWQTDGKMFDSSYKRNTPAEFPLTNVIKGWTDGLQVMSVGDKVRFWIPEELAYKGSPGRPQGMLVFDVELLEIK